LAALGLVERSARWHATTFTYRDEGDASGSSIALKCRDGRGLRTSENCEDLSKSKSPSSAWTDV